MDPARAARAYALQLQAGGPLRLLARAGAAARVAAVLVSAGGLFGRPTSRGGVGGCGCRVTEGVGVLADASVRDGVAAGVWAAAGVDVLPAGLCELEFFWDGEYMVERVMVEVVQLLARKAELVPALKRVKVAWAVGVEREILRAVCGAVDVEFVENGEREDGSDDWGL